MDLGETRIGEKRPAAVSTVSCRHIATHRIGRQEERIAVAAAGQNHRIRRMGLDFAGHHVPRDDAFGLTIDNDQIEHFVARMHFDRARRNLMTQLRVNPEEQLLPGLAARVKCPRHLRPTKGTVGQHPAIFPGEGHALRHTLVDDVRADLRQAVDIRLTRAEVAALDRVHKQTVHAVAVILVILRRIDPALRRDAVRPARTVLIAKALHVVALLAEDGRRRSSRQTGAHDDQLVATLVARTDQLARRFEIGPFVGQRTGRNFRIEGGRAHEFEEAVNSGATRRSSGKIFRKPVREATGMLANPIINAQATSNPPSLIKPDDFRPFSPKVWNTLEIPWLKCIPSNTRLSK